MKQNIFLLSCFLTFLFSHVKLQAQNDQAEIAALIEQLFTDMHELDAQGFQSHFVATASLHSYQVKNEELTEQSGDIGSFVQSFKQVQLGDLDERIATPHIQVDRFLAMAWVPYQFYYKGALHHCGTNVLQLIKAQGAWKIARLSDTHYKDCAVDRKSEIELHLDSLLNNWHRAAATANAAVYFEQMQPKGVYIGTDARENWPIDSFQVWSQPYFDKGKAWDFKPLERHIYLSNDATVAWFDELLDTWMGVCRGSGALELESGRWVLKHYVLSVTVPNEDIQRFIEIGSK